MTTTMSSREFNQDTGRAKRAALEGPVIITDRGRPSHVLMTVQEYERLVGGRGSIVSKLAMREGAEVEFEPVRLDGPELRPIDLS